MLPRNMDAVGAYAIGAAGFDAKHSKCNAEVKHFIGTVKGSGEEIRERRWDHRIRNMGKLLQKGCPASDALCSHR